MLLQQPSLLYCERAKFNVISCDKPQLNTQEFVASNYVIARVLVFLTKSVRCRTHADVGPSVTTIQHLKRLLNYSEFRHGRSLSKAVHQAIAL
jgi:hypothetical protein